jgi:hypothetical protein
LIAQNGDPRKIEIAFAQAYFAEQTRKFELITERLEDYVYGHGKLNVKPMLPPELSGGNIFANS